MIDYDNDGDLDIYVTNFGFDDDGENNLLYRNVGDGSFERVTDLTIVNDHASTEAASWADFDNDGDLDVILANYFSFDNVLYISDGYGTFELDLTNPVDDGIAYSSEASWVDYDIDGYLDVFIANPTRSPWGTYNPYVDFLYRNIGGTLTRILVGEIATDQQHSYGAGWCDFDNDGDPDVLITANNEYLDLYQNEGNGVFAHLTEGVVAQTYSSSLGGSWADYDNDGDMDVFVPDWKAESYLFANNGDGTFTEIIGHGLGQASGGKCISGLWADYDNDGDQDMFAFIATSSIGPEANLFENMGDGSFTRILTGAIATDATTPNAAVWGDYDRDGFLDLYVAEYDPNWATTVTNSLYHNDGNSNHWLTIKPIGTLSNRSAIGTKVRLKAEILGSPVWQMRELTGLAGRHSQGPLEVHFGLGDALVADSVQLEWPSGRVQVLRSVAADQFLTVVEPCCEGKVGDANGSGDDEPTIGDVTALIDAKFIAGMCTGRLECLAEADVNGSGGSNPTCDDITIGDISLLIDYLFVTGASLGLPGCSSSGNQPLEIPFGAAVNVDGVEDEGEWNDASTALISVPGEVEATVYAKHDGANLLIAFRYSFSGDEDVWVPEVLVDVDHDRASDWQGDDWWIHVSAQDCAVSGAYDIWTVCGIVQPDWEAVPNFVPSPHTVPIDFFEIRFPLSKAGLSVGSTIGLAYRLRHSTSASDGYWPASALIESPSTWGTAVLEP
jgi:hypothetical protein